ncbi:hypothetical protein F2Q69_00020481 [Brassica cretica]|uniref:Uncharacterized protein n=1 Tax=Brassica cretica TaxID=69181 RepID=A0A8S9QI02_BRACR|nr:hypothetical protein F2Q69_00020481 [Brassica cretica]
MAEKASRCFDRVRDHFTRLEAFEKAKNLYGQTSGTKTCLEVIKASGTEIPQEMIDVFAEQEKLYEVEVMKLRVEPLSDSDLTLSPLVLPSRFVALPPSNGLDERPENENLEGFPGKDDLEMGDTLVREEETENVGIEDPVLVSDSSSEEREDEEKENDGIEETFIRITGSNAKDNPSRLVVEKGKGVTDSPSPIRDARVTDSPPDDFDLIHRDALWDSDYMTLSQRLLVADAHKIIRDECADRVEVGICDVSGSGSEASSQASRPLRRASREIPFDQIDCRPTIYHPGGIFKELGPLPSELLRDPRDQSWGNALVRGRDNPSRLVVEKGKGVADSPSPIRDARVTDSPPDDSDLIHRDALQDSDNMTLSQRFLVADAHKMIRDECADRVEVGSSDVNGSGSEASSQASRPLRRASREVPFDQIDCRPTIYHPGGIFEELCPLPSELLRDPRAQSWGNVFDSCSSHKTVRDLLRRSGGAGVTNIIHSKGQRPWSPPIGYQCVYESYFGDHTKLWFPIPRLITSYAFRRDITICQLLNGSLRIAVMLM